MIQHTGKNTITTVLGKKGSGKSFFTKKVLIPLFPRLIIIDPLDEYNYFYAYDLKTVVEVTKANWASKKKQFRIVYRPLDEHEDLFFKFVYGLSDITVLIEEVDGYSNGKVIDPYLERLYKYGRHKNINLICISRRPAEIGRLLTAQSDIIISFLQTEKRDIDYFKNFTDDPDQLKRLRVGEYKVLLGESELNRLLRKTDKKAKKT